MGHRRRLLSRHAALISFGLLVALAGAAVASAGLIPITPLPSPGDVIDDVASDLAGWGGQLMAEWVAQGAGWLVESALGAVSQSTDPRPDASWFDDAYARMAVIGMLFAGPCFLLGMIQSLLRQDGRLMGRVVAAIPASVLLTGAAIAVSRMLLGITDQASSWLIETAGQDVGGFGEAFSSGLLESDAGSGFVVFLVACVTAVGALVLWVELLVRSALVYVLLAFFPIMAALMIWPSAAGGVARLVRLLVAIILSKLVVVAVIAMGIAAALASGEAGSFEGLLVGAAMVIVACFAPMAVHRLLPILEESVHVRGNLSAGGGARNVVTASYTVSSVQNLTAQLGFGRRASAAGAPRAGGSDRRTPTSGGGPANGPRPLPIAGGRR